LNYRHAFHAGNFADVMKHALLVRILVHLLRKATPFFVLDTHAGRGLYDLAADAATRTGEWRGGVARLGAPLAADAEALIAPYRAALAAVRARHGADAYPGSPLLVREFLRAGDRALAVELHPEDFDALAATIARAGRIKALKLDGWTALHANIPPKERRGLVLIDPPYEAVDEMRRLVSETGRAHAKWPGGVFALWYPLKDVPAVERFARDLKASGIRKVLRLELSVGHAAPGTLHGCGLVVINPPFTLADEAKVLLPALAERLATDKQAGFRVDWLAGEA
jgi:23S rRNA (adenine2030-N6)-methyltransferase